MAKVGFHIHTHYSDGKQTLEEVILKAVSEGIKYLCVTDHNSIEACKEFESSTYLKQLVKKHDIMFFTGTEIYCSFGGFMPEMLGYGIDVCKIEEFLKSVNLQKVKDEKENLKRLYQIFANKGFRLSDIGILEKNVTDSKRCGNVILANVLSFDENKELNKEFGFCENSSIYDSYLSNRESEFYFESQNTFPHLARVSEVIKTAGGLRILAHPGKYPDMHDILNYCIANNLIDGVECYHPLHSKKLIQELLDFCRSNNLLVSGGTDNHSLCGSLCVLPNGIEISKCQLTVIDRLLERKQAN